MSAAVCPAGSVEPPPAVTFETPPVVTFETRAVVRVLGLWLVTARPIYTDLPSAIVSDPIAVQLVPLVE